MPWMAGPPVPLGAIPKLFALGYNFTLQPGWCCHPQSLMVILKSPTITQNKWCLKQSIIDLEYTFQSRPWHSNAPAHTGKHRHAQSHVFISLGVGSEAATLDFSFPCYSARAGNRPPCGHGLVLSLCLCLLRHSSDTSHHHHGWGTGAAPLHLQL